MRRLFLELDDESEDSVPKLMSPTAFMSQLMTRGMDRLFCFDETMKEWEGWTDILAANQQQSNHSARRLQVKDTTLYVFDIAEQSQCMSVDLSELSEIQVTIDHSLIQVRFHFKKGDTSPLITGFQCDGNQSDQMAGILHLLSVIEHNTQHHFLPSSWMWDLLHQPGQMAIIIDHRKLLKYKK